MIAPKIIRKWKINSSCVVLATENAVYTDQFCGTILKSETHTKFKLKLDFDIFDNKHTDSMLSNHNEMSILYKRL